ncbi:MAG: cobalamin-dependent protein [Nitrospira sp.]|nr:cobalamin-dependent protein [Nitrospira sp.]
MPQARLDVLLVNPGSRTQIYQALGSTLSAIEPPVWGGLIATFLRRRGISVDILDANAEDLLPEEVAARVKEQAPRLVVVLVYGHNPSASTQVMPSAGAICRSIKEQGLSSKVLLLGGHVAALPERTLREEAADFVCAGEGLYTITDLVAALQETSPDWGRVRGLYYWSDGSIQQSSSAPNIERLDEDMPGLAWDLLPMDRYRAHNWHCFGFLDRRSPYASLYTTLGCPYHCSYCCIQAPFKSGEAALGYRAEVNSYRFWSPKTIAADIDRLVLQYGVRHIKFADEMFVLNRRHVTELCQLLIERQYDLNIWAYARVDSVKDGMEELLVRAGVRWLCFGIESGSAKVRNDVLKTFEQDQIGRTIERVRAAGINVIANYIFGLPEDDHDTMQATLDLAIDLNCEFANFYCTMAYPGSALYRRAVEEGWPLPDSWTAYSQHAVDSLPLPTRHLHATEVLAFRDSAFQAYFDRPAYRAMLGKRFDEETVRHVQAMTSRKLVRQPPAVAMQAARTLS